jgi:hypothetical protein
MEKIRCRIVARGTPLRNKILSLLAPQHHGRSPFVADLAGISEASSPTPSKNRSTARQRRNSDQRERPDKRDETFFSFLPFVLLLSVFIPCITVTLFGT